MKMRRILSALLSAVMTLGFLPTAVIDAKADGAPTSNTSIEWQNTDWAVDTTKTGQYIPAYLGKGVTSAVFMNGEHKNLTHNDLKDLNVGSRFNGNDSIDNYNMMRCFGIYRNGKFQNKPESGFSRISGSMVSSGGAQYGGHILDVGANNSGGRLKLEIAKNETLKTLAESGGLEMYYSGYACAAKQDIKAWPDDHTYVWGHIKVSNNSKGENFNKESGKASDESKKFSSGGWVTLGPEAVIEIYYDVDRSSKKFTNGWADRDVGVGGSILLFRKTDCPNLKSYTLTANGGTQSASSTNTPEILLGKGSSMTLEMNVTRGSTDSRDVIVSALDGNTLQSSAAYNLLSQLGRRVLFYNSEGTGYERQGKPVYMYIAETKDKDGNWNGVTGTDEKARVRALSQQLSGFKFNWTATYGDYYGNNPLPKEGDWAGKIGTLGGNNGRNLLDSIVLASYHDLAGNPLQINEKDYHNDDTIPNTALSGKVVIRGSDGSAYYGKRDVSGNPFAVSNGGFNFIIDAVPPTYSVTSNAVQPDVLTRLTLNKGDEFDVYLNFSEGVQIRKYDTPNQPSYLQAEDTVLVLNNGMEGTYVMPDSSQVTATGSKQWRFHFAVKEDTTNESTALEVSKLKNGSVEGRDVLTDYVGNKMEEESANLGTSTTEKTRQMSWAMLKVDNTAPTLTFEESGGVYVLTATDNQKVFAPELSTGDPSEKSILWYTWVPYDASEDSVPVTPPSGQATEVPKSVADAITALTKNNYAAVKRYSLAAQQSSTAYALNPLNNGATVSPPTDGGNYYLLYFATDMTWDSARQLTQYNMYKAQKETETGAKSFFANAYQKLTEEPMGDAAGGYQQVKTDTVPQDWATSYTDYFIKVGSSYAAIPAQTAYPEYQSGKFYEYKYDALPTQPSDWETNYTDYYQKNNENKYVSVPTVDPVPEWKSGTYYARYWVVDSDNAPDDFQTANYYIKSSEDGSYKLVYKLVGIPEFTAGSVYSVTATEATVTTDSSDNAYVTVSPAPSSGTVYKKVTTTKDNNTTVEFVLSSTNPKSENGKTVDTADYYKWSDIRAKYYVKDGTSYLHEDKDSPNGSSYYTLSYTAQSAEPDDWDTKYRSYYVWQGNLENNQPKESEATYQGYVNATETKDSSKTYYTLTMTYDSGRKGSDIFDWETEDYYTKSGNDYVLATGEKNNEETYYKLTNESYSQADVSGISDSDWKAAYGEYYTQETLATGFVQVTREYVEYVKGRYYQDKGSYQAMTTTTPPSDWKSSYEDYYTDAGKTHVTAVTSPTFTANTYYHYTPVALTSEPANWETTWQKYFVKVGDEYQALNGLDLSTAGLTLANAYPPARVEGGYLKATVNGTEQDIYGSSADTKKLAEQITDKTRHDAFEKSMAACTTWVDRVKLLSSYVEFEEAVLKANQDAMKISGAYDNWTLSSYQQDDSNWTYAIGPGIDKEAPRLALAENPIANDNTKDPSVTFTAKDSGVIALLSYQFVRGDAEWDSNTNWKTVIADSAGAKTAETVKASLEEWRNSTSGTLETGTYYLYVQARDAGGNEKTYEKLASVRYNAAYDASSVTAAISFTDGTAPERVKSLPDGALTVTVKGSYKNEQPYASTGTSATLAYAVTQDSNDAGVTGWKEISVSGGQVGAAGSDGLIPYTVELPAIGAVEGAGLNGIRYIHIKLSYSDKVTYGESFSVNFDNTAPQMALNAMGYGVGKVTVSISSGDSDLQEIAYQWAASGSEQPAADDEKWTTAEEYPVSVTYQKAKDSEETSVTLWVKATDTLGNVGYTSHSYPLPTGETQNGEAPAPSKNLLQLTQDSAGDYTAIFELVLDKESIKPAMQYAYSIATGERAAIDLEKQSWSRWMPYESMVRIALGRITPESTWVLFRFRTGEGDPTDNATVLAQYCVGLNEPTQGGLCATVSRSTVNRARANPGVTLIFTAAQGVTVAKSDGDTSTALTADTIKTNGVYTYTLSGGEGTTPKDIYVAVNNIVSQPPTYSLLFSGRLKTSGSVMVEVIPDAGSTVTAVTFTPKDSTTASEVAPSTTYTFTENGTAVFTLDNGYTETVKAEATVDWIDRDGPDLNIRVTGVTGVEGGTAYSGKYIEMLSSEYFAVTQPPKNARRITHTEYADIPADEMMTVNGDVFRDKNGTEHYNTSRSLMNRRYLYFVEENGIYNFSVMDTLGAVVMKQLVVDNIVKPLTITADEATGQRYTLGEDKKTITITGTVDGYTAGNRVYWGGTEIDGSCYTPNEEDGSAVFTINKTFNDNVSATAVLTDTAGHSESVDFVVDSVDRTSPVITRLKLPYVMQGAHLTDVLLENKTLTKTDGKWSINNFWDQCLTVTDNTDGEITFSTSFVGDTPESGKSGSYFMTLTAKDAAGNTRRSTISFLVAPKGAMLITDKNGVMFYSGSGDVALLENDDIELNISNYRLMQYRGSEVTNTKATYEVYIQKGLYREGQMKTLLGSLTFDTTRKNATRTDVDGNTSKLTIAPEMLDGAGWYTILVRNSERMREYTTFFISTSLKGQ